MSLPLRNDFLRFSPEWWEACTTYDPDTKCLRWNGFADPSGYCRISVNGKGGILVHRHAYECFYGPFDQSLKVCHSCDVPNCVSPYHLFLGTQKDNLRDMFRKGRARPRGRVPRRRTATVTPLVSPAEVLSENSDTHVATMDIVHLRRTLAPNEQGGISSERWRHVIGVPPVQPTQAVVLWKRPQEWTGNSQANRARARYCPDTASPVSSARQEEPRR